jgi:RNA polymerase sigma-70 factor, ECF subfamily
MTRSNTACAWGVSGIPPTVHLAPGGTDQAPLPGSAREHQITTLFADAFECGDVQAIIALLTSDAWLTMPPLPFEYRGRDTVGHFLHTVSFRHGTQLSRLVPTRANPDTSAVPPWP